MPANKPVTRSLSASVDPARRMQELLQRQATPPEEPQVSKDVSTYSNTQVSNEILTSLHDEVSTPLHEQVSEPSSTSLTADVLPEEKPVPVKSKRPAAVPRRMEAPSGQSSVRDKLQGQGGKEAVVRLSVDVSETLHSRIRQYCAMHRVPSSRFLIITLVEDFLESEGF